MQTSGKQTSIPNGHLKITLPNWTLLSSKAKDLTNKQSLISAHILSRQRLSSTLTSHPVTHQGSEEGFIKGEALRLLRTTSSAKSFVENINQFKARLRVRDYPDSLVERITSEDKFSARKSALQQRQRVQGNILPFVTTFHPAVSNLKNILMSKWHLIQNQPSLRGIYKEPPIVSYKKGKSLGIYS